MVDGKRDKKNDAKDDEDLVNSANRGALIHDHRVRAILHELGLDIPFDYNKAFENWKKASELGDQYSEKRCQELLARGYVAQEQEVKTTNKKNRKILLIDDDGDSNYAWFKILHTNGYKVVTAENGLLAMNLLALHPDISLVILDLNMPGMNGLQFLKQIRALDYLPGVPILICTGFPSADNLLKLKKYNIDGCLTKPVDTDGLLKWIEEKLKIGK